MSRLHAFTGLVGLMLIVGEVARWWGQDRFLPMAFDEIALGGLMLWAALGKERAAPRLALAWGVFCGLVLGLLVPTLDHLLNGPPKASAGLYAGILSAMLGIGLLAAGWSLRISREPRPK